VTKRDRREYHKKWYEKNKERISKQQKEYYEKNKERILKQQKGYVKEYYEKNKERISKQQKEYYEKNKERLKEYYEKNKERKKEYDKKHYEKNKERINERKKECRTQQPAAVYKITNIKTGTTYIGQSTAYRNRWANHKWNLRHNRHGNKQLQEDWDKYGEEAFIYEVIEKLPCDISRDVLLKKESEQIKKYLNEGKRLYNKEGG